MNAIDMDGIEETGGVLVPATGARVSDVDEQLAPAADAVVLPGYYASVRATRSFELGQHVRVLRVAGRGPSAIVHYQHRTYSYTQDAASFLADFAPAPEGEAALNRRMLEVTEAIGRMSQDVAALQQALQHVTVHVDGAGEAAGLEAITAIVPVDDRSPAGFKIALARVRQLAHAKQAELQARQNELQGILAEKMAVANALLAPLQAMVGQIEEAIWTVNLYLGRDEAIVRLRDGAPAPASTPISLRQLVLAMDEECAVAAEEGGIDARSIDQFDAWLLERPEHLDQVLPEPKGVVVLAPRRQSKDYGDPWTNRAVQEADRQSYFLIRNGERLYRICTDFIVGTTLLPRRDEFLDFFVEKRVDWETRERTHVALEPGSRAYMEAEKRADARGRHYFRIGLILQGLIDRTPVFHPLPGAIQVTRPEAYDRGWLRIIADAEPALGDGHERFRDWHARLNATLDVGMRVIGTFSGWSGDYASFRGLVDKHGHPRLSPATAGYPRDNELYRLEGKRDGGFFFLYARAGDEVYDPYEGWRAPKLRAACVVHPDDRFVLAYDAATVEEMEYYLKSRQDRQAYVQMFPLLKAAIRMKREEAAAEAPFHRLLTGEIVKAYGVDVADAEAAVPELVRWYKFKNKHHRPLVGDDDGKALRLIVAEFAVRLRERDNRETRARRGEFARVTRMALERWPQALLVAHKAANVYVALVPHNAEPVYVEEITFTPTGVRERKTWRTVDTRWQRWHVLHTSDRWAGWQIGASRWEHLTDPEIADLGPVARRIAEQSGVQRSGMGGNRDPDAMGIMAVCFDRDDNAFHVYILAREAVIPVAQPLTGALQDVRVEVQVCTWSRTSSGRVSLTSASREGAGWEGGPLPWEAGVYRRSTAWSRTFRRRGEVVLEQDEAVIARAQAAHAAYTVARQERERLAALVRKAEHALAQAWITREEARRYSAFLAEYGDPALWEGHQKTLPKLAYPYHRHRALVVILEQLVERGIAIDGLTFGEARRRYEEVAAGAEAAYDVVGAEGRREMTLPDDLDDLVLATAMQGRSS